MENKGMRVLAQDYEVSLDTHKYWINNNLLVVGSSGSGKTKGIVEPNLEKAEGSYLVSDPKGALYKKYEGYFKNLGYDVKVLDFVNPGTKDSYNPFLFIKDEQDIMKLAHLLVGQIDSPKADPFWDRASEVLVSALIGYMVEFTPAKDRTMKKLLYYLSECYKTDNGYSNIDVMMMRAKERASDCFAVRQYSKISSCPVKTLNSILVTIESKLGMLDCDSVMDMLSRNDIHFSQMGKKPSIVFVVISDTDRSLDKLANIFFTQALNELTYFADNHCENGCLPVPVQFIMDDFATNVIIDGFPRAISTIRSRNISTILILQAESQLEICYGTDAKTIIGNCDTYVYLGGNDLDTAKQVAERCDKPLPSILYMPFDECIIFRRGERPVIKKKYMGHFREKEEH